jgi:diguanylate cyclase
MLEMVRNEAQCDPLTSLANRAAFDRALSEAIARAQSQGAPLTLTLRSLDYFTSFCRTVRCAGGRQSGTCR